MSREPSKMLIEAGIIPKNTLKELARWRFLPEGSDELHGAHPLKDEDRGRFVKNLSAAITKDMAEIRETELDVAGNFKPAWLHFKDGSNRKTDVIVDRLYRVFTPCGAPWKDLKSVFFDGERSARTVVKRELRYDGDRVASFVHYLEPKEG